MSSFIMSRSRATLAMMEAARRTLTHYAFGQLYSLTWSKVELTV